MTEMLKFQESYATFCFVLVFLKTRYFGRNLALDLISFEFDSVNQKRCILKEITYILINFIRLITNERKFVDNFLIFPYVALL